MPVQQVSRRRRKASKPLKRGKRNKFARPLSIDPTRTTTIQRKFEEDLRARFELLKGRILRLIVDEDAFGIRPRHVSVKPTKNELTANQRWAAKSSPEQLALFETWLKEQVDDVILTTDDAYWERYVQQGYEKGAGRAFTDINKLGAATGGEFYEGGKERFLKDSFANPVSIEHTKLLASRTFNDLKGVTDAMSTQMVRSLAGSFTEGKGALAMAKDLTAVDGIGKRRATLTARTEVVRAHAEGQLDTFEAMGVARIGIQAEWSTAGDDRVCPLCQPLEGTIMSVKEARGIIPRHPVCRCVYKPIRGEFNKQKHETALKKSIEKEIAQSGRNIKGVGRRFRNPETGAFDLKEPKLRQSKWVGADPAATRAATKQATQRLGTTTPTVKVPTPKPKIAATPTPKITPTNLIPKLVPRVPVKTKNVPKPKPVPPKPAKITKAPKKPALSVADAEAKAKELGVTHADFSRLKPEHANALIDAVEQMPKGMKKPMMMGDLTTAIKRMGHSLERNQKSIYGMHVNVMESVVHVEGEFITMPGGNVVGLNTRSYKTLDDITAAMARAEKRYAERGTGRTWWLNPEGEAVARHEIGHVIGEQLSTKDREKWEQLYRQWRADGLSADMLKNESEAFAEAWAAVKGGHPERVTKDLVEFIEGL